MRAPNATLNIPPDSRRRARGGLCLCARRRLTQTFSNVPETNGPSTTGWTVDHHVASIASSRSIDDELRGPLVMNILNVNNDNYPWLHGILIRAVIETHTEAE